MQILLNTNVTAAAAQRVQSSNNSAQNTVRAQAAQQAQTVHTATQQAQTVHTATQQAQTVQSNTQRKQRMFNVVGVSTREGTVRVRATTLTRAVQYAAILSEEGDSNITLYALSAMCTKAQAKQQLAQLQASNAQALVHVA
jgi:hypothetical protein